MPSSSGRTAVPVAKPSCTGTVSPPDGYVAVRDPGGCRTGARGRRAGGRLEADPLVHRRRNCWFQAVPYGQGQLDVSQHVLGDLVVVIRGRARLRRLGPRPPPG